MKRRERVLAALLLAAALALLGLLFGPVLMELFIKPMATGLWALLRIFVLAVDQDKLWTYLTLGAAVLVLGRAMMAAMDASARREPAREEPDENAALRSIGYWKYLLTEPPRSENEWILQRRELTRLLLSAYASRERVAADFALYIDFESRRIALPEEVYEFLFTAVPRKRRAGVRLHAWLRRVSGREEAEYRRSLGRYVEYLRFLMEIRDEE